MTNSPERYRDEEVLSTYLETANISIYMHGPIGTDCFSSFFTNEGTRTTLAYVKPNHWKSICSQFERKEHILVLRDPMEQHKHAAYLHGMSLHNVNLKRENMFYYTHLQPHLMTIYNANFDFYIPFEKISQYLLDYQPPDPPHIQRQLYDITDELTAYEWIKENKMELTIPQWRDLIMRGQLDEI